MIKKENVGSWSTMYNKETLENGRKNSQNPPQQMSRHRKSLTFFRCLVKLEKRGKIHNLEKSIRVDDTMIRN